MMPLGENNSLNICHGIYCRVLSIFIRLKSLSSVKALVVQKWGDKKHMRPHLPAMEPSRLRHAQYSIEPILHAIIVQVHTFTPFENLCHIENTVFFTKINY